MCIGPETLKGRDEQVVGMSLILPGAYIVPHAYSNLRHGLLSALLSDLAQLPSMGLSTVVA